MGSSRDDLDICFRVREANPSLTAAFVINDLYAI